MSDARVRVVPVGELKTIVNLILDHIVHDLKIETVSIEEDFYWDVDSKGLYDVQTTASELDIGSLIDDWEFLAKVSEDHRQAVALMLIHAAPLLRYIGEKVGQ
jgi:hypothetical protein